MCFSNPRHKLRHILDKALRHRRVGALLLLDLLLHEKAQHKIIQIALVIKFCPADIRIITAL